MHGQTHAKMIEVCGGQTHTYNKKNIFFKKLKKILLLLLSTFILFLFIFLLSTIRL